MGMSALRYVTRDKLSVSVTWEFSPIFIAIFYLSVTKWQVNWKIRILENDKCFEEIFFEKA